MVPDTESGRWLGKRLKEPAEARIRLIGGSASHGKKRNGQFADCLAYLRKYPSPSESAAFARASPCHSCSHTCRCIEEGIEVSGMLASNVQVTGKLIRRRSVSPLGTQRTEVAFEAKKIPRVDSTSLVRQQYLVTASSGLHSGFEMQDYALQRGGNLHRRRLLDLMPISGKWGVIGGIACETEHLVWFCSTFSDGLSENSALSLATVLHRLAPKPGHSHLIRDIGE